jgi:hypothetical protein
MQELGELRLTFRAIIELSQERARQCLQLECWERGPVWPRLASAAIVQANTAVAVAAGGKAAFE